MSKVWNLGVKCSNKCFALFLLYLFCTVKPELCSHKYSFNYLFTHTPFLLIFFLPQILDFMNILLDPGYYVEVA